MTDNEILLALSNMLEPIREDIGELKGDVRKLEGGFQEMNNRIKKIELTQENVVLPRLQNIESCYISTYDRYKESVDNYDAMRQDVSILKKVVAEHSEKLQKIS